ncbi:MAG: hypothetical protein AAFR17_16880 [Pseudomonadota bacterium]
MKKTLFIAAAALAVMAGPAPAPASDLDYCRAKQQTDPNDAFCLGFFRGYASGRMSMAQEMERLSKRGAGTFRGVDGQSALQLDVPINRGSITAGTIRGAGID